VTIREALTRGIRRVRLSHWESNAYIELPILPEGYYGPWATIHDSSGEIQMFIGELTNEGENSNYEAVQE